MRRMSDERWLKNELDTKTPPFPLDRPYILSAWGKLWKEYPDLIIAYSDEDLTDTRYWIFYRQDLKRKGRI